MNLQPIFDLAQICHQKGIKQAVISPGSRNAALTIAFARHPKIKCYSVPDERSAAFIALGISLKTKVPTVLICTSGSAALNYAPAVAEAYFNQVPMLILSADRPPEWIGQRDGQTIFQEGLFGKHAKKSFIFPSLQDNYDRENGHQMATEAINFCLSENPGPVHINIPFREPFYPEQGRDYTVDNLSLTEFSLHQDKLNFSDRFSELSAYSRILIVVGQDAMDKKLVERLSTLSSIAHLPVIADVISNAHDVLGAIKSQDLLLKNYANEDLRPDLLITIGMSVISKNLKIYLRTNKPEAHWHIRNEPEAPDTYKALTKHINSDSLAFISQLSNKLSSNTIQEAYYHRWQFMDQMAQQIVSSYKPHTFSEIAAYRIVINALPFSCDLHLANSMAVRYANIIGLNSERDIEVYCNRGTSGIDGSSSTALGSALMTKRLTFLLTGDMAFLYDKNAFWHNHIPDNLCIVVFNNHGGGIFRMIEGPSGQPELEEYFETRQNHDARLIANEYNFEYFSCRNMSQLLEVFPNVVHPGKRKIVEIFTDAEESKKAYKELFRKLAN